MRLETGFDPEFLANLRRCYWPIRSIGHFIIVVALSGLMLSVMPVKSRRQPASVRTATVVPRTVVPRNVVMLPGPPQRLQAEALEGPPRDPFVIAAPAEIDPKMVVMAPAGIDEEMVFNPHTRGRQSGLPKSPPSNRVVPVTGPAPGVA